MTAGVTVLQVLGSSAGGIARHVAHITGALRDRPGLRVEIACPEDLPFPMPPPLHPVAIPDGPLVGHRAAVARIRAVVAEVQPDVIHAHGLRAGIDAGLAVRKSPAVPLLTVHNLVRPEVAGPLRAPLYRWAEALAVRLSSRVLCVSREIAEHLGGRGGAARAKIEVLYLGVGEPPTLQRDRAAIRRALEVPEGTPLVVTASRLAPQKRLRVMLGALERLPGAVLCILGEGPEAAELEAAARDRGLAGRVRFLGFRSDVADFIAAADAFCLSSIWEGIPLAVQEALALGTPVVGTDVGGMPEVIADRRTGRLVPPNDPQALAEALDEVLSDRARAHDYRREGKEDLSLRFSEARMLDRLVTIYREAAGVS